jgi:hypothetical protein
MPADKLTSTKKPPYPMGRRLSGFIESGLLDFVGFVNAFTYLTKVDVAVRFKHLVYSALGYPKNVRNLLLRPTSQKLF